MNKIMYCTLDTETVGGASNPTGTYNYGGKIHDRNGNVFASFSLLVSSHYDDIKEDDYAKKNFPLYERYINEGKVTVVPTEEMALDIIRQLCRAYNVKYLMAYNSGFDFVKTACRDLIAEREFIDIYLMTLQTITHIKKYAKFCINNGFCSASGKSVATSAESVYAYLTNNVDYSEEHTAFEDSKIEMKIFLACLATHKKFTKNEHQWNCKQGKCFPRWVA